MHKTLENRPNGWWAKEINPNLSLIILIIASLTIFGIGVLFAREYIGIWVGINQLKQEVIYFPEKPGILEKMILP